MLLDFSLALLALGFAFATYAYRIRFLFQKRKALDLNSELLLYKLIESLRDAPPTEEQHMKFLLSCQKIVISLAKDRAFNLYVIQDRAKRLVTRWNSLLGRK